MLSQATLDAGGAMLDFDYAFFSFFEHAIFLVWRVDVCFGNDRSTPSSTAKAPFTVDELQELMKLLVDFFIPSNWIFSDL